MTTTTNGADNHNKENPPQRGKIREEGQGKEEGLASAKEVHHMVVQVDDSNTAFLLMAEATVVTVTASLSTVASGASLSLGSGTMTIIPRLSTPRCALDDNNDNELARELVGT